MKKTKLFGGYFKYLPEHVVKEALFLEWKDNNMAWEVKELLSDAWFSRFWEHKGFDGKSFISDTYEPRMASFLHDYMSRTGRGGKYSDVIFKYLEKKTGTSTFASALKFGAVRVGSQLFILRDKLKGNRNQPTQNMMIVYNLIKNGKI